MKRRKAREVAIQCLYQMEINRVDYHEAIQRVQQQHAQEMEQAEQPMDEATELFARQLLEGTEQVKAEIDQLLEEYLQSWKVDRLSKVDLQILRMAVYELVYSRENPPKVIVNEAIELAKYFGTEESGKFVNGVLGKILQQVKES